VPDAPSSTTRALDAPPLDARRWKALAFIGIAQLMVVLDATIVNIALPQAQADLAFSDANRQWVITAYSLAFGGLLLFGGRLGDLWGRKRVFLVGLVGFAVASALGGAAVNTGMLLGARALQGLFAALLAPAALSLVAVTFTEARERATAFGVFSAIAGAGGAVGLLLGGALTEYVDWRWCLYVNIVFAVVAATGAVVCVRERDDQRNRDRLDLPGAVLGTTGLVALVYGFSRADEAGWTAPTTIGLFVAAVVLLVAFVLVERRVATPLLPLRVVTDRNRAGAFLGVGLAMIGMFAQFFFMAYYFQLVAGYSPLTTGFAFLPHIAGLIIGSTQIGTRLANRVPVRRIMVPGLLTAALGMLMLTRLTVDSSYWVLVMPATVLLGVGMGAAFMPAMTLATQGIRPQDAGVASAMVNTSQQVGGSIGTALLNTIAAGATTAWITANASSDATQAAVYGYVTAFWWALAIMLLAALLVATLVRTDNRTGATGRDVMETQTGAPVLPVVTH
jgi:EmrB/QacA subfamily drug resistance transporter